MIHEYAIVRLKRSSPSVPLPGGTKGTVLIVHKSTPAAYEVEFVDESGRFKGVYTVHEDDVEVAKPNRNNESA